MVKKILTLLHTEITGIHQAAYLLGVFAFCSQILAVFRDRLFAYTFGASQELDVYYAAFRVPDFLFVTMASVVSISVLIPFIVEHEKKGIEELKRFLDSVFSFFFLVVCVVGTVTYIWMPQLLTFLFPSFVSSVYWGDLLTLSRLLILSPVFLGFSNLLASVTQVKKRFFVYALSPILYNMGIIVGITVLYPLYGLFGLGVGVVLGALCHALIQLPFIIGEGLLPKIRFPFNVRDIRHIIYTSIPRTITVSSNELAELFLISFASFLVPGSISIFNLSFNLQSVPFSIIGVSYALASFPILTSYFSKGDEKNFLDHMIVSSRHIIFWSIPVSVLFVVLRAHIVRVILGTGRFNWEDTRLTAAALGIFIMSLVAQNLTTLFVRSYYARGRTKEPLFMNSVSAISIVVLSYLFVYMFNHTDSFRYFLESLFKVMGIQGTSLLMLPLGFSIGVYINLILHWFDFHQDFPAYTKHVAKTFFQVTSASIIMGFCTYVSLSFFSSLFSLDTFFGVLFQAVCAGGVGILSGVIILIFLKNTEVNEVFTSLHKKFWKAKVVPPDARM